MRVISRDGKHITLVAERVEDNEAISALQRKLEAVGHSVDVLPIAANEVTLAVGWDDVGRREFTFTVSRDWLETFLERENMSLDGFLSAYETEDSQCVCNEAWYADQIIRIEGDWDKKELFEIKQKLKSEGVELSRIERELEYRETSGCEERETEGQVTHGWDDALCEFTTDELEDIAGIWEFEDYSPTPKSAM